MLKKILKRFSGIAVFILVISLIQVGMASTPNRTFLNESTLFR